MRGGKGGYCAVVGLSESDGFRVIVIDDPLICRGIVDDESVDTDLNEPYDGLRGGKGGAFAFVGTVGAV
jgi:hypothetical protein